jgi:SAM domain (Sterile alpha motif)
MQQIADWLEKLGMSEYAQRFAENDIDMAVLPDLTGSTSQRAWRFARAPVENAARDPRSRWRFGCRHVTFGTRADRARSAR